MSKMIGVRVVRGPNWKWGDQDGGEGNVGTVIGTLEAAPNAFGSRTVTVVWDSGIKAQYRTGPQGCYDLRIVDSAMTGVKHPNVPCGSSECSITEISGIRWQCVECQLDLCSNCFIREIPHDVNHRLFKRYDNSEISDPPTVTCWSEDSGPSSRIKLIGLYPGAEVMQGIEWTHDRRHYPTRGTILPSSDSNVVLVEWSKTTRKQHQRGHRDLKFIEPGLGGFYHPDALSIFASNDESFVFQRLQLSALQMACKEGQKELVPSLLDETNIEMDASDENGFRAVHYAVKYNEVEILKMLIAKGAQLDGQSNSGRTALHLAASNQFAECCRLLIDAGCDVNIQDSDGDTALHNAIHGGRAPEIIKIFASSGRIAWKLRNKAGFNVLHIAVLKNYDYATEIIMEHADMDIVLERIRDSRCTVLHYACSWGDFETIKLLVGRVQAISSVATLLLQMFLEAKTSSGMTAALIACEFQDYNILELLMDAGSDLNIHNEKGNSMLERATFGFNTKLPPKDLCPAIYEDPAFKRLMKNHRDLSIIGFLMDRGWDWDNGHGIVNCLKERGYSKKTIKTLREFSAKRASIRPIHRPHKLPKEDPAKDPDIYFLDELARQDEALVSKDLDDDVIWNNHLFKEGNLPVLTI